MPLLQIEISDALAAAIDARQLVMQARSRRVAARMMLENLLQTELQEYTTAQPTTAAPLNGSEPVAVAHAKLRDLGWTECQKEAEASQRPLDVIRGLDKGFIEFKFESLKADELIPEDAVFRPFLTGWRGSHAYIHGVYTSYARGCRCANCKHSWKMYKRDLKEKRKQRLREQLAKMK